VLCVDVLRSKSNHIFFNIDFEQTDGLVWVVDSADIARLEMCRDELQQLLIEDVMNVFVVIVCVSACEFC
jgi:hypothetical protein